MGITNVILNHVVVKFIQSMHLKLRGTLSNPICMVIQYLKHSYRFDFTRRKHYSYASVRGILFSKRRNSHSHPQEWLNRLLAIMKYLRHLFLPYIRTLCSSCIPKISNNLFFALV